MGEILSSLRGNVSGGLLARVLQSVSSALNKNKRRVPLVGVWSVSSAVLLEVWWLVGWITMWWFQIFFYFHPLFGEDFQFDYLKFFRWVETTNQITWMDTKNFS